MQNGDFFDFFKRNRQNEVKKLRSFPWPFKTYKQFELLKISEIEKGKNVFMGSSAKIELSRWQTAIQCKKAQG